MKFVNPTPILFRHCDPVGIVFYPRYFEIINDTVEKFFDEALDFPFYEIMPDRGVPIKKISTEFLAPSRLGEVINIELEITKVGVTSLAVHIEAIVGPKKRFIMDAVMILVNSDLRPEAWPDNVREKMNAYVGEAS